MILVRLIEALRSRPQLLKWGLLGGLAVLVLWDALLLDKYKAHTWLEKLPGGWSLFGLAGCVTLIVVAKWLVSRIVTVKEDYYD